MVYQCVSYVTIVGASTAVLVSAVNSDGYSSDSKKWPSTDLSSHSSPSSMRLPSRSKCCWYWCGWCEVSDLIHCVWVLVCVVMALSPRLTSFVDFYWPIPNHDTEHSTLEGSFNICCCSVAA